MAGIWKAAVLLISGVLLLLLSAASARPVVRRSACHGRSSFAFSFPNFSHNLDSLALLGDASISSPSALLLSGSHPNSVGALFYSSPLRSPYPPFSFVSSFSFSMPSHHADGLAFLISPSKNSEVLDPSNNHVVVRIERLISQITANLSDSFTLDDGAQLFVWIDYLAPLRVLEVRLSKSQSDRPEKPILSLYVDLSSVWKEEMFVGFSSSSGSTPQKHIIHSWSFATIDPKFGLHDFGRRGGWHGGHPDPSEFHHNFPGWHHPRPGFADWHHHPRPGFPEEHHHPRPGFPGFSDEHQHPRPGFPGFPHEHHHGPHGRHGPPHLEDDDSWLESMSDVWRIVISLLFGATCGTAVAVFMLAVWSLIRRRWMRTEESEDDTGMLYGYQKLITPEANGKVDAGGYQKLPTTETDGKAEDI